MEVTQKHGRLRKQIFFEEYVPEDSMKEAISLQNPVLDNLDNVNVLDNCLRDILKEKRKTNEQNIENIL